MRKRRVGPDGEPLDVNSNDVIAFLIELFVLVLLCIAGFHAPGIWGWVLGIGLPVVAGVAWGLFAAPRARYPSFGLRLATKIVILGAGIVAGFLVLPTQPATLFAVLVVLNLVLMYVGPMARPHDTNVGS